MLVLSGVCRLFGGLREQGGLRLSVQEFKAVIGALVLVTMLTSTFCVPARAPDGPYLPDVMVAAVGVSAESVTSGETLTVNVTVSNIGERMQNIVVKAYLVRIGPSGIGDFLIGRETLPNVPSGASSTVAFTLDTTYAPLGDLRARGEAVPVPGEVDTADNTLDGPVVSIRLSPTGDVRVTSATPRYPYIVPSIPMLPIVCAYAGYGWMVLIPVGLEHLGNTSQSFTFNVTLYFVDQQGQQNTTGITCLNQTTDITLNYTGPGNATTLNYIWNLKNVDPCKYNFTGGYYVPYVLNASTTPIPGDSVASDNSRSGLLVVRLPGDVNGDGYTDVYDLAAFGKSWYKKLGVIGYDEMCDFTGDGIVDIFDLTVLGKWWYKRAPDP